MQTLSIDIPSKTISKIKLDFTEWVSEFKHTGVSDYVFDDGEIMIFVDFNPLTPGAADISKIEFLDADFEPILTETTLNLQRFFYAEIEDYNKESDTSDSGYSLREELAKERYYNQKYALNN